MAGRIHPIRRGVLLLAVASLAFHVCALDPVLQELPSRAVSAGPTAAEPGQMHDVHAASCDGVKLGMLAPVCMPVLDRVILDTSLVVSTAQPTRSVTPGHAARPPLFLLHASLRI